MPRFMISFCSESSGSWLNMLPTVRSLYLKSQYKMLQRFLERKQNEEKEA